MKVAILDPYLDTLGGGERYLLSIAEYYSKNHAVDIFWPDQSLRTKIKQRFQMSISQVQFREYPLNAIDRYSLFSQYDLFFYATDGSLFYSPAKKSILLIQSPAHIPNGGKLFTKIKMSSWNKVLCYSRFVKEIIDKKIGRKAIVLEPPVDLESFLPGKKENIILITGRFFSFLHSKKQDFLVDCFIELITKKHLTGWKLILIGSVQDKDADGYLAKIKKVSQGYPIKIITDASLDVLKDYYAKAKIFWLATGFGEDLITFPERAEHFGIVTVEAMAAECVPIVFNGGGQTEIVNQAKNGFLFKSKDELMKQTLSVIKNEDQRLKLAQQAKNRSTDFSKERFLSKLEKIVHD